MAMSLKRGSTDAGHSSPPFKHGRSLEHQGSISDIIAPQLDQFHFKRSESVLSEHEKNGGETEVDGFVCKLLSPIVSSALKTGTDLISDIGNGFETATDGLQKGAEDVIRSGLGLVSQPSVEETPSNNVRLMHPVLGAANMVPMGMHIQLVTDDEVNGHRVLVVDKGQLADQAKLKVNDVLVAINDTCTKDYPLEDVLQLFGTISKTFSMTVIRRDTHAAGDKPKYLSVTITVDIGITDGDVVGVVSIDIKTTPYIYTQTVSSKLIIAHKAGSNKVTKYLKIKEDETVTMESFYVAEQCNFTMHLYEARKDGPAPVCTFCNATNSRALDARNDDDVQYKIVLGDADDLTNEGKKILSDNRFFFYHSTGLPHEQAFESVEKKDHFVTFEQGVLKLTPQNVKSLNSLPNACRFTVCGAECDVANNKHTDTAQNTGKQSTDKRLSKK